MSPSKPSITIRYGASNDDITVDGHTFVRHEFSRDDRDKMRTIVIEHLKKVRYFSQRAIRHRPKRRHSHKRKSA